RFRPFRRVLRSPYRARQASRITSEFFHLFLETVKKRTMSSKRISSLSAIIVLLAIALVGSGCATTSQTAASYKPHKPQMITESRPTEVDESTFMHKLNHGFDLSDDVVNSVPFVIVAVCLRALCGGGNSWKP